MKVEIPSRAEHYGSLTYLTVYEISDYCPICNSKRGIKMWKGFSYDGSRRLVVDCWENECKHIDLYSDVRKEALALKGNI